jgi:hypothetical protein
MRQWAETHVRQFVAPAAPPFPRAPISESRQRQGKRYRILLCVASARRTRRGCRGYPLPSRRAALVPVDTGLSVLIFGRHYSSSGRNGNGQIILSRTISLVKIKKGEVFTSPFPPHLFDGETYVFNRDPRRHDLSRDRLDPHRPSNAVARAWTCWECRCCRRRKACNPLGSPAQVRAVHPPPESRSYPDS